MNQIFLGGIALIIAFILWGSKKQSKIPAYFKSKEDYLKNRNATTSFVQNKNLTNIPQPENLKQLTNKSYLNKLSLNSIETKKKLTKLISSNPNDRLLAIKIAIEWNNIKALPFLRRGLKDSDSRVVIASAAGISSYKGKTINLHKKKSHSPRPPRNVSLIR
tara:strand:- start:276 stop:761 length:486 start_codon:yes stop_codon:yes gene_type:complete